MLRVKTVILLILVAFFVNGLSCWKYESPEHATVPNKIVIPEFQKLSKVDPLLTSSTLSARLNELIFDGLVQLDDKLEVQPQLVSSWQLSEDQLTWTFYLQKGVAFHDGTELTAEDIRFTLDSAMKSTNQFSYGLQMINRIDVIDKHTFTITLKEPLASFLSVLTIGVLPKPHLIDEERETVGIHHPIGTGRFMVQHSSEEELVLIANKEYFRGRPSLNEIIIKVYPNQEMAWSQLMMGNVDIFPIVGPPGYERMRQIPMFLIYSSFKPYYYVLVFNLDSDLFSDKKVRQALNYAIDKGTIISKVLKGYGQIAEGSIYPDSWAYNTNLRAYDYDPQKALMLLKQLGWQDRNGDHILDKDSLRFEFTVHTNRGDDLKQQALLLIQQQLFNLGIKMNVKVFDAADVGFLFRKQFDAFFPEIEALGDPDLSYKYWHSSQINEGFNVGSYRSTKVDQLLEQGRHTFDRSKRKAIYNEFQQELLDDPPGIFLFWTNYLVGVNKRIQGVKISPAGPFTNIHEWYVENN